jgi:hypothetical protein
MTQPLKTYRLLMHHNREPQHYWTVDVLEPQLEEAIEIIEGRGSEVIQMSVIEEVID